MVKCGLELHQRLNTKHKLFCNCSASKESPKEGEIKRKLHVVRSELGKIDTAAKFETGKDKTLIYDIHPEGTCLVELDEEPPRELNMEAVEAVLTICSMMKANPVDEIQIMRKTILDGSNTSGFQRTTIVGTGGRLITDNGSIAILAISLEEESCGIIGESAGKPERYRLDRLGIPLIEIATAPTIKNGKEARAVAERMGLTLRAAGVAMRGIGTVRQDINVSVDGGARVEIKGVQSLDIIEMIVDNEITRQNALIELHKKIKQIKKPELKIEDVTDLFKDTQSKFIRAAVWKGKKVKAVRLKGMKGLLGVELYPNFRFGSELSGYAKANGAGGIIHSDEKMRGYGFGKEIDNMKKQLKATGMDAWVIVVAEEKTSDRVLKAVFERAFTTEVPEETRRAEADGRTYYMRPLPGAARLYPETDVKPFRITSDMLKRSAKRGVSFDRIKGELRSLLNPELADKMIRSEKLTFFREIMEEDIGLDPMLAAITIEDTIKTLRREGLKTELITDAKIKEILISHSKGRIVKSAVPELLKAIIKSPSKHLPELITENKLERIKGEKLAKMIQKMKPKHIGEVMQKARLNVDPDEVKKILTKKK